jgi:hypothetical protein
MKRSLGFGVALGIILSVPTLAAEAGGNAMIHHHHMYRHIDGFVRSVAIAPNATAQVPPPATTPVVFPAITPYPNGQGDEDGLSRHIGDCNKGCIGGNPG